MPPKSKVAAAGGRGQTVDSERLYLFLLKRNVEKLSIARAGKEAGISRATANRIERGDMATPEWRRAKAIFDEQNPKEVIPADDLSDEARRALNDFAYFRRRYFGRVAMPWATHTAGIVADLMLTEHEEFVLCNEPPGVGKSTFWTMDLAAWLIVRNRAIRIMLGSASQTVARQYVHQLRREFEREVPMIASADDKKKELAFDAEATLIADFGTFKPSRGEAWTADEFVVRQVGNAVKSKKEPTVSAYGRDSTFIGHRVDVAIWDDLVSDKNTLNPEARDNLKTWWPKYGESRIEPGGLMVLQGQRLHSEDLYHSVEEIEVTDFSDADDEGWGLPIGTRKKYIHIKYKAHYDEYCNQVHHPKKALPFDPEHPETSGCLLDPRRLTYRKLMGIKEQDQRNYVVTYQQEDMDTGSVLVKPLWVKGGTDPDTGETFPGVWDPDRRMGEMPNLSKPYLSVVTADPSPTKFWSIQWWVFHMKTEQRFLIDHARKVMEAGDFLNYIIATQSYTGLLEEWHQHGKAIGAPFTHVVIEQNAAQRFLLQTDFIDDWRRTRSVTVVPHDTYANKTSKEYGVQTLLPKVWRYGNVRLPNGDQLSRGRSMPLVNEVTHYEGDGRGSSTTDCVMAQWFAELTYPRLRLEMERPKDPPKRSGRPSWLGGGQ